MSERVTLDAGVAEELCDVLELCCSWLDAAPATLDVSLWRTTAFDLPVCEATWPACGLDWSVPLWR